MVRFITIIGLGAQEKYAVDICNQTNLFIKSIMYFPDFDNPEVETNSELYDIRKLKDMNIILCGNEEKKRAIRKHIESKRIRVFYDTLIHPKAVISPSAEIGKGCIINAGAIIQPTAKIGNFCMIHANSVIEHNCNVGDYCNIAPGVTMCGWIQVDEGSTIYTNSAILPSVKIGKNCIIAAGSVLKHDVPDNHIYYGTPKEEYMKERT